MSEWDEIKQKLISDGNVLSEEESIKQNEIDKKIEEKLSAMDPKSREALLKDSERLSNW